MAENSKQPAPASCSRCGATWKALGAAHCAADGCHRTFSSAGLFDLHRQATVTAGKCLNPVHIRAKGQRAMFYREGMWRGPQVPAEDRARLGWRQ